ncbi:MAG: transketolase C-terminal domain-containing protein [Oceanicaulis sp.]
MRMTMQQALVSAIAEEMRADTNVFVMGEDVGAFGGPLRSTAGLFEEFGPERVRDMPMSESAIVGAAVGAALQGKRPVVDLMFLEFLGLIMQQLFDAGAMHYYSGGAVSVPMVVRGKYGVGPHHGHQYDLHSWAVNTPGIKVVAPASPADAKGLMRAAIRDPNPVLFLEHMGLYHAGREEVSEDPDFIVPLGLAKIARPGADVSVFASAMMVKQALRAAKTLEGEGIDVEVVDLRTIAPLDRDTVLASARKTGRAVVACEAIRSGGSANDVAALLAEEAYDALCAPVVRVTPPAMPVPFHRQLEGRYVPGPDTIADAVRKVAKVSGRRR